MSIQERVRRLNEQAEQLKTAYASFRTVEQKIALPSKWQLFKGYFDFNLNQLPKSFDWRDRLAVPPAKFQGNCNSCSSFAAAAAIEVATLIAKGGEAPDVSAQHMHTCTVNGSMKDSELICASGISPGELLELLTKYGYATSLSDSSPFPSASCNVVGPLTKLKGYTLIPTSTARSKLTEGPLFTDMYVWPDFFTYVTERSPTYSPDTSLGVPLVHSVCVLGYTPNGWVIKNSLGSDWGDGNGFGVVQAGTCGLLTDSPPPGRARRAAYALEI